MSGIGKQTDRHSISSRLRDLILHLAVPLCLLSVFLLLVLLISSLSLSQVSRNISTASQFNQNFKDEVDLKMYLFVTGSDEQLPWEEVQAAETLATALLENTHSRESYRAANSVLDLCENLRHCIQEIESTDGYDLRMHQLESNIYVITELIQKYIYNYLYHEAGELAAIRARQNLWLSVDLILALGITIVVIVHSLRRSFRISGSISQPIDGLYQRVIEIGEGDLSPRAPVPAEDSKLQALGTGLEEMVTRLNDQMELNRQEQIRLRSMELALIQAQINPHFLYNTLDAIVWLIETGKNDQAIEMVSSLSTYFRSFLSNGKDIIPLGEEIQHVRSYLEIQQVRYKDILAYDFLTDPSLDNCLIPKMTLQPLVENAIYHGIKPKRGISRITISSSRDGDRVLLNVADSGIGMGPEALQKLRESLERDEGSGFGMKASYKRLRLMFGSDLGFDIESTENRGTEITIRIPYQTEVSA